MPPPRFAGPVSVHRSAATVCRPRAWLVPVLAWLVGLPVAAAVENTPFEPGFAGSDFGLRSARAPSAAKEEVPPGAEHDRAVELARAGRYDEGLAILYRLLERFPDDYPLQRDTVVILTWKGDCEEALQRFARLRGRGDLEPYLIVPVSDCLLAAERPKEAAWLVRRALARHPGHEGLEHALLKAQVALKLAGHDEERPQARFALISDESERGPREWRAEAEAVARIAAGTRLYARYLLTRSSEASLDSGDLDRLGLGIRYRIDERWLLEQEFSRDTRRSGQGASRSALVFEPRDTWRYALSHTTFAEDLPLRARASGVEATQTRISVDTHRTDWLWEGFAVANRYDFSDGNERTNVYATAGYAYARRPEREHRLFIELYQSRNSLGDTQPYYNPRRDRDLGIVHRTDFSYDTRFKRHVDRLSLAIGSYWQEGFGSHTRWSVRYEQDYDFDDTNALVWAAAFRRQVYDGVSEDETRLELYYRRRF